MFCRKNVNIVFFLSFKNVAIVLSFFDLWLLIIPVVSPNLSLGIAGNNQHFSYNATEARGGQCKPRSLNNQYFFLAISLSVMRGGRIALLTQVINIPCSSPVATKSLYKYGILVSTVTGLLEK